MLNPKHPVEFENVMQEESLEPDSGTPGFCRKTRPEGNQSNSIDGTYRTPFAVPVDLTGAVCRESVRHRRAQITLHSLCRTGASRVSNNHVVVPQKIWIRSWYTRIKRAIQFDHWLLLGSQIPTNSQAVCNSLKPPKIVEICQIRLTSML